MGAPPLRGPAGLGRWPIAAVACLGVAQATDEFGLSGLVWPAPVVAHPAVGELGQAKVARGLEDTTLRPGSWSFASSASVGEADPAPGEGGVAFSYDCGAELYSWRTSWSETKQRWCCQRFDVGCPGGLELGQRPTLPSTSTVSSTLTATSSTSTTEPFDCNTAAWRWQLEWSPAKMSYCCPRTGLGCTTTSTVTTTTSSSSSSSSSRPPFQLPINGGCDSMCIFDGMMGSCKQRVQWYARHALRFREHACGLAQLMVKIQCPMCAVCQLPPSSCEVSDPAPERNAEGPPARQPAPGADDAAAWVQAALRDAAKSKHGDSFDCEEDYDNWLIEWPPEKKQWCCRTFGRGCLGLHGGKPAPHWQTQPSEDRGRDGDEDGFNCDHDYSVWVKVWSPQKKAWCCKHTNRGCPPDFADMTEDADGDRYDCESTPREWPQLQQEWCCLRKHRGCQPSRSVHHEVGDGEQEWDRLPRAKPNNLGYDCSGGFEDMTTWSMKQVDWCCRNEGRGCPENSIYARKYEHLAGHSLSTKAAEVLRPVLWCAAAVCASFGLSLIVAKGTRKPLEGLAKLRAFAGGGGEDARGVLSFVGAVKATSRNGYSEVSEAGIEELEAGVEE